MPIYNGRRAADSAERGCLDDTEAGTLTVDLSTESAARQYMKSFIYILIINHLLIGGAWAAVHMEEGGGPRHASVHVHIHAELGAEIDTATDDAPIDHDEATHVHLNFQVGNPAHTQVYPMHADHPAEQPIAYLTRTVSPPVPPPNA